MVVPLNSVFLLNNNKTYDLITTAIYSVSVNVSK